MMSLITITNVVAFSSALNYRTIHSYTPSGIANTITVQSISALNPNALSQRISAFYNTNPRIVNFNDVIGYRQICLPFETNRLTVNYHHYPEQYFLFNSHEEEAKRLQKFIKGTLLKMIEKIKASILMREIMHLRFKTYRLISISKKIRFSVRFFLNIMDKEFLLFKPVSDVDDTLIRKELSYTKSIQLTINPKILSTIVA